MAYAPENKSQWHAGYWNENKHGSAWQRAREAMKRDWAQTKADFGAGSGKELDQDVDDTVKQAIGKDPIPPMNQPNPEFDDVEPALAYGFGAHEEYGQKYDTWNQEVETKLRTEWDDEKAGRAFDDVKPYVRRGWDYRPRK